MSTSNAYYIHEWGTQENGIFRNEVQIAIDPFHCSTLH